MCSGKFFPHLSQEATCSTSNKSRRLKILRHAPWELGCCRCSFITQPDFFGVDVEMLYFLCVHIRQDRTHWLFRPIPGRHPLAFIFITGFLAVGCSWILTTRKVCILGVHRHYSEKAAADKDDESGALLATTFNSQKVSRLIFGVWKLFVIEDTDTPRATSENRSTFFYLEAEGTALLRIWQYLKKRCSKRFEIRWVSADREVIYLCTKNQSCKFFSFRACNRNAWGLFFLL